MGAFFFLPHKLNFSTAATNMLLSKAVYLIAEKTASLERLVGLDILKQQEEWSTFTLPDTPWLPEGLYLASTLGRVKSVERRYVNQAGKTIARGERILQPTMGNTGYYYITLSYNGQRKVVFVHTVIATAFCERLPHHTMVNHIDEDKTNNHASNLEWTDAKGNQTSGTVNARRAEKGFKAIDVYDPITLEKVGSYKSIGSAAENLGTTCSNVSRVLKGCHLLHGKYYCLQSEGIPTLGAIERAISNSRPTYIVTSVDTRKYTSFNNIKDVQSALNCNYAQAQCAIREHTPINGHTIAPVTAGMRAKPGNIIQNPELHKKAIKPSSSDKSKRYRKRHWYGGMRQLSFYEVGLIGRDVR